MKHLMFMIFLVSVVAGLFGVLMVIASFTTKWAYPAPLVFLITGAGFCLGSIILLLLVVVLEQLFTKEKQNPKQ
jgi:formate/nitrite transporter FocA (FNT family)